LYSELGPIERSLAPWLDPKSKGKQRINVDKDGFSIRWIFFLVGSSMVLILPCRCVGVWDTVGALGLPNELVAKNPKIKLFGFSDPGKLGTHIRFAFQALALNERRVDFVSVAKTVDVWSSHTLQNCNKFEQTSVGRRKGQVLKQVRSFLWKQLAQSKFH